MNPISRWLQKRKAPSNESPMVSMVSICYRCGQVFVNEIAAPNHVCVGRDVSATYSFDADTTATCAMQFRDFTITREEEKK